ncbi:MAG TPA: AAA family ATPase [Solirubrobacterales bacterium]|nr:AAA family ATPase [Solirubrobacterales bacterium]
MGFLSRKKKQQPVVEETHPLEEELKGMEEAVPERVDDRFPGYPDEFDESAPTAGPVVDEYSSSQAAGEEHPSAPPAEDEPQVDAPLNQAPPVEPPAPAPPAPQPVNAAAVNDDDESGDGRMRAIDLIAPTRLDFLRPEPVEPEVPVDTADVIAFANQKGGVAKTTTTLNLAVAFAESGYRVLCVDLDPQGNLTMSQGIDPDKVEHSLYDVLVNDMPLSEIIVRREIDIAVASIDLAGAEIAMSTKIGRERSLEKALKEVAADYDFVCIDTPPSLGLLTINALTAANKVIVPVQCEYLSMRGLVQLQNTLRMIQENLNPDVHIEGILPTMLDTRTIHAKEAVEILEENFGDLVFQSRIRKAIKFAEAPVKGASVLKYDSESSAAGYYRDLAKEVLSHGSA